MKRQSFITGQTVPATGIYLVKHRQHKLAEEVVFLKGGQFPPCSRCARMGFELLQAAPYIFSDPDFGVPTSEKLSAEDDDEFLRRVV
ncbi:MAG TPA: hypothetical protein VFA71_11085 [Terriglobales bacterium]|nr:hypothetical protein [Terriglobales bacterium]